MSYIERERQRAESVQQEQLDWLYQQQLEIAEQTIILRQQTKVLEEIRDRLGAVDVVARLTLFTRAVGIVGLIIFAISQAR